MLHLIRSTSRLLWLSACCLGAPLASHASDTYDPATNHLSIASMHYGNMVFSNLVVTAGQVLGVAGGAPRGSWDVYSYVIPTGFALFAPSVTVGSASYTNVTATIGGLVSVGGVTGADVYDGQYLYIPVVAAGSKTYNYVIVTVAHVDGVGGGFPGGNADRYSGTTNQLTIAAVAYAGKVYTNVVVTVGSVVSVNGSASVGARSSACYSPLYYQAGTTMDLFYEDFTVGATSAYEVQSLVLAPSTFNGVANATGIQLTTLVGGVPTVATGYYDIHSKFPVLVELGFSSSGANETWSPGIQFGGALSYGQSLQTAGTQTTFAGSTQSYGTNYIFEGFEDITTPAGRFPAACRWNLKQTFGANFSDVITWTSHQGVVLQSDTVQLQAGSRFNGAPVAP